MGKRIFELLHQTNGILCGVHLMVGNGKIINLIDAHDKTCKGFLFSCPFSSSNKDKIFPQLFFSNYVYSRDYRLLNISRFMWCYPTHMTNSKDTHHHQMVVLCSGSLPSTKYGHLGRPSFEEPWLLHLRHRPLSAWSREEQLSFPSTLTAVTVTSERGGMRDQVRQTLY